MPSKIPVIVHGVSNAIIEAYTNPEAEGIAWEITSYIAQAIDDEIPLSVMIAGAPEVLGYKIHPQSFFAVIATLCSKMGPQGFKAIGICDDINMFSHSPTHESFPIPTNEAVVKYVDIMSSAIPKASPVTSPLAETNTVTESSPPIRSTPVNPDSHIIVYQDTSSSGSDSGSDSGGNIEVNNNNRTIVILTITTFLIIQLIAWYARRNNKDIVEKGSVDNEDPLHSVYEPCEFIFDVVNKLLLLLVPMSLLILYDYRYYYLYLVRSSIKSSATNNILK